MNLGRKIRHLRQSKGWSLADLSKQSGVALSSLSRIETGKMTGTLESHLEIAKALGARLSELYSGLEPAGPPLEVHRRSDAAGAKGVHLSFLTSSPSQKKMMPALITLQPRRSSQPTKGPAGSERFLFLIQGEVQVTIGEENARLKAGESVYLDASFPHTVTNVGSGTAQLLSVSDPPAL